LVSKFGTIATRGEVVEWCASELGSYRAYNVMRTVGVPTGTRGEYDVTNLVADVTTSVNTVVVGAKPKAAKKPANVVAKKPAVVPTQKAAMIIREDVASVEVVTKIRSNEIAYEPIVVPERDPNYVPFGCFADTKQLIKSGVFAPAMIFGHSGYGKTTLVEQACAQLGRKLVVCQITEETCEDDLIGGMRLVNGSTVFEYGPIARAYQEGAVVLLDEVDQGTTKLMCLQNALQAKPLFLKKTGETIYAAAGFMVIATGNTKGIGDDIDGRYVGAKIMNEAFLERFSDTMTQGAPRDNIETKILSKVIDDAEFVSNLVRWANLTREACSVGQIDREIQTRRLLHIAKNYEIYGDKKRAVEKAVNRFEETVRDALLNLYTKVDASVDGQEG